MPWVVVGEKPMPMVTEPVEMFWASRYLREVFVTAEVICAVLAVVTEPKRVVSAPLGKAETVTELPIVTVPATTLAFTYEMLPVSVTFVFPTTDDELLAGSADAR